MNKKILMSVAAAATLAMTFTGCGSDDSSSTNTISGVAQKANLNGATVTIGGTTTTTGTDGSFSVNAPAGSTDVEIKGGTYTLNGTTKTNAVTLKATTAQINAGAPISLLTTLAKEFDGNVTKAANALGITYVEGQTNLANIDAGDFESAAVVIAAALESSGTNSSAFLTSLKASAANKITDLNASINTAASAAGISGTALTKLQNISNAVATNKPLGYALALSNSTDGNVTYTESDYLIANSINVEANATTGNNYSVNGSTPGTTLPYSGGAIGATGNMDNNNTLVSFNLTDNNSTLTNANGNTSVFIKLSGLDAANAKSAYVMGLTGLDLNSTNLTFISNATMALKTYANSNVSYSISADSNATVAADFFDVASGYNVVNVAKFKNYMDSVYSAENSNTSTIGYFTNGMNSGNYSLKVYVNVADQKVSYNNKLSDVISSSMKKATSEGTTLFSGVNGYKVLDANLSY